MGFAHSGRSRSPHRTVLPYRPQACHDSPRANDRSATRRMPASIPERLAGNSRFTVSPSISVSTPPAPNVRRKAPVGSRVIPTRTSARPPTAISSTRNSEVTVCICRAAAMRLRLIHQYRGSTRPAFTLVRQAQRLSTPTGKERAALSSTNSSMDVRLDRSRGSAARNSDSASFRGGLAENRCWSLAGPVKASNRGCGSACSKAPGGNCGLDRQDAFGHAMQNRDAAFHE
jgi:hypothetical protein